MARKHRATLREPHTRMRLSLSITAMVDVVFMLLVYFLLTSGAAANERVLRAEMPDSKGVSSNSDPFALETDPLIIELTDRDGAVYITLSAGLAPVNNAAQLERRLADVLLTRDTPRGLFAADHPIRIAAASDVPWEDVVGAFNAIIAAGYRSVAFGNTQP